MPVVSRLSRPLSLHPQHATTTPEIAALLDSLSPGDIIRIDPDHRPLVVENTGNKVSAANATRTVEIYDARAETGSFFYKSPPYKHPLQELALVSRGIAASNPVPYTVLQLSNLAEQGVLFDISYEQTTATTDEPSPPRNRTRGIATSLQTRTSGLVVISNQLTDSQPYFTTVDAILDVEVLELAGVYDCPALTQGDIVSVELVEIGADAQEYHMEVTRSSNVHDNVYIVDLVAPDLTEYRVDTRQTPIAYRISDDGASTPVAVVPSLRKR